MTGFGEFPGGGGSGSGGGSVPKNVVIGGASESVATIEIPGISGSPDILPASPSALNDEFDENGSGTPAGWTTFNSPDTCNTNDFLSHLHLKKNAASGAQFSGIYKAIPAAYPFTMTVKLTDAQLFGNFMHAAIFVSDVTPGVANKNMFLMDVVYNGANFSGAVMIPPVTVNSEKWTDFNTFSANIGALGALPMQLPIYLRIVATSTSSLAFQASFNGYIYRTWASAFNPAITLVNCGLCVGPQNASQNAEAVFDWVRFT